MKRARSIKLLLPGLLFWLILNGCEGCLEENPHGSETNPYPDQTPPKFDKVSQLKVHKGRAK